MRAALILTPYDHTTWLTADVSAVGQATNSDEYKSV